MHDSSWHSREEQAEREGEREGGDSFPLPSPTHSLPAFPSLAGGKGGRQAGRQAGGSCRDSWLSVAAA